MTPDEIKAYLSGHSEATKSLIEVFVNEPSRKFERFEDKLNNLRQENNNLRDEVDACKSQINENVITIQQLESDKTALQSTVDNLKEKIDQLNDRCDDQEDRSRRSNLRFDNVPETENETWEKSADIVTNLIKKLNLPEEVPLERVHRVGKLNGARQGPRTIIAKFARSRDRETVYRSRHMKAWKDTGISMKEDLSKGSRDKRTEKWPELQQAWKEGKRAFFNHTKIVIKPGKPIRSSGSHANASAAAAATEAALVPPAGEGSEAAEGVSDEQPPQRASRSSTRRGGGGGGAAGAKGNEHGAGRGK